MRGYAGGCKALLANGVVKALLDRHREALAFGGAALVVRVIYNLFVHPPLQFVRLDMRGYLNRATAALDAPWTADPRATFFPWGTHTLIAAIKALFGRENGVAIAVAYAILGAITVTFTFLTAERLLGRGKPWTRVLGVLLVVHVPWISSGGFVLSETPFACALAASVYASVRFFDEGQRRHAGLLGLSLAAALAFRPQALVSIVLLALYRVFRPRAWAPAARQWVALVCAPIVAITLFSMARTRHHTGSWGFVSTNMAFNYAFGRCHPSGLAAAGTKAARYEIPSFLALRRFEAQYGMRPIPELDPAIDFELKFDGQLWESRPALDLAHSCVQRTGVAKQVKYAATHVLLLWAYNVPWPTHGLAVSVAAVLQAFWLPGIAVFMARSLRRGRERDPLLGLHLVSLVVTAAVFVGEARLRMPYDGVLMLMGMLGYTRPRKGDGLPQNPPPTLPKSPRLLRTTPVLALLSLTPRAHARRPGTSIFNTSSHPY